MIDLVNFSNTTKKTESKLNFGKNSVNNNHSNNKLFLGRAKNENTYSDMMFRKDNNVNNVENVSYGKSDISDKNYSQTQKKLYFNKNNKKWFYFFIGYI